MDNVSFDLINVQLISFDLINFWKHIKVINPKTSTTNY